MKSPLLTLFFAVFLLAAQGQSLSPVSLEQLVNTDIPTTQYNSQVAADPNGGYVIIWTTQSSGGSVIGRRYDNTHTAISGEITINTESSIKTNIEHWKDGKYVVSYLEGGTLKFTVLDAANTVGAEVTVIASTSKYDLSPKGDSLAFIYNKTSNNQLYLRGYNLASNSWLNTEMLVTEIGGATYDEPNVVYHTNGRMTAIYHLMINTAGCCTFDRRIMRKTFSSSYVAEIPEYAIWSTGSDFNVGSDVDASGNNNNEVIITTTHGTTSSMRYMRLWILGSNGSAIVNNAVMIPAVTTNDWYDNIEGHLYDNGDFLISKTIRIGGYQNPNGSEAYVIYGKNYNASNSGLLRMNSTLAGDQQHTSVAKLPNGGFIGCWSGNGFQGDTQGIYARAYNAVAFPSVTFSNAGAYTVSEAGTSITIGVALAVQPSGNVTVDLSSSDLTEGTVSPAQLTFTSSNWNVVQNITVTGVDDTADDGNITFNVVASTTGSADATYAGLPNKTQAVINLDNDATITMPSAQSFCKSTGMSGVNAIITNVGSAITSVTGSSSNQAVVDNSDITVNNLGSGTYGVVINNLNNNTTGTAQITLTATDGQFNYTGTFNVTTTGVTITTSATANTICQGQSVTLSASGAPNITWNNGVQNNVAFTPSATTTYTATGDDGSGCTGTATQTITVNAVATAPTVSASGSLAICGSGSVTLTSSYATGNTWSTGETTQSITVSTAGNYTVTYAASGFCSVTSVPSVVTVGSTPAAPIITPNGPTTFCEGGSVTLTSSQASGNTWSTNATSQTINVTTTNTYQLTYTDANGCTSAPVSILVTVQAAPAVSAGPDKVVCVGSVVTLLGSGAASYSWTGGVTNGIPFIINNQTTFEVTGTGSNGCTAQDQMTVTVNQLPSVSIATIPIFCLSDGSEALTQGTPSGGDYTGPGITGVVFNPAVAGLGIHPVSYSYTDPNGCVNTANGAITVDQCLGMEELAENQLSVYPNPTTGIAVVEFPGTFQYFISDAQGRTVLDGIASEGTKLDLSAFSDGVYQLTIQAENTAITVRLVKN